MLMHMNAHTNIPFRGQRLPSINPLWDKKALCHSHGKNHSERQ